MKATKLFVGAIAATIMLASCAKGDNNVSADTSKKSVAVKIANLATPETRAAGAITPNGTAVVEAADLTAFFYAGNEYADTRALAGTYDEDNDEYVFNGLPGNVTKVIFTNMTQTQATAWLTSGTLPSDMATWNPASGNVKKTPVIGVNAADFTYVDQITQGTVSYRHYQTSLTVNAVFARIEISGIECTDMGEERFNTLGLEAIGMMYGNDKAAWDAVNAWQKDSFTSTVLGDNALDGVYVYNVAPGAVPSIVLSVIEAGTTSQYPNLVENLGWPYRVKTGALYTGSVIDEANKIDALEAGAIYQIKYSFEDEDVKPWDGPEPSELICVDVEVTIANWVVKPVITPEFN
jgi:hypothetical protein